MQIIIQNSGVSEHNGRAFHEAAEKLNIQWKGVGIVPFTYEFTGAEDIDFTIPTFYYGSTRLIEISKRDHDGPGVYFNEMFDVLNYMDNECYLPRRDDFLNPVYTTISFKDLSNPSNDIRKHIEKTVKAGTPVFLRPSSSLKDFAGTVITTKNIDEKMIDIVNVSDSKPDDIIIYSNYKEIWAEWRFFVIDGTVVTGSLYKEFGRLEMRPASKDILMIASAMATKWLPLETCVMDIALTKDGMKVIEFNSVNASGAYDCDVKKILIALQELIG